MLMLIDRLGNRHALTDGSSVLSAHTWLTVDWDLVPLQRPAVMLVMVNGNLFDQM